MEGSRKLQDLLTHGSTDQQQIYQMQMRKLELTKVREENKFLLINLDSISNPNMREFFRSEQGRILQKRIQE